MNRSIPSASSLKSANAQRKIQRVVVERGLCGLVNDTKWDEFISEMRSRNDWKPRFRFKCVEGGPSEWDTEWFYHLPFPFVSVEWFDITYLQDTREHRLPPRIHTTDHSAWIEELLRRIGLEYHKGKVMSRIFGYSPKSMKSFDEKSAAEN